jgi:glycosyltransferase involved in cell wall biosynthesis
MGKNKNTKDVVSLTNAVSSGTKVLSDNKQSNKNDIKSVNQGHRPSNLNNLPPDFLNKPIPKKYDGTINKKLMALVMMIKNEEKRITVSFDSVKDYTDTFIILDTGSTDSTIQICKDYCQKNNITLHLKEEPFVNFMTSRNVNLDFADEVLIDPVTKKQEERYLLFLDCNDELQNADELMRFVHTYQGSAHGFYLKQKWWSGNNFDSYFNIRMVKSHKRWRYRAVVHEYLMCEDLENKGGPAPGRDTERLENVILFQDRTKDDDKSFKRFFRDKEMLYNEYLKNPKDPRTLFYLAQTCGCLGNLHDAYKYYNLRIKQVGFIEEIYHAYYRLGEISKELKHPWEESLGWFLRAFEHSQRAEPLVRIAEYYKDNTHNGEKKNSYLLAYTYASMACKLVYPQNQILFVDRRCYTYKRWHTLGQIAFYAQRYKEGKDACLKAIQAEENDIDYNNLLYYLKKDSEINQQKVAGMNQRYNCLTIIQTDKEDIVPPEETKQLENKITREEALRKAIKLLLSKN